jgi:hypothetical protein
VIPRISLRQALADPGRGELWRVFQKHYGGAGDPLIMVAKGLIAFTQLCGVKAPLTA